MKKIKTEEEKRMKKKNLTLNELRTYLLNKEVVLRGDPYSYSQLENVLEHDINSSNKGNKHF